MEDLTLQQVSLVFALANEPVSVDQLAAWQVATPGQLWDILPLAMGRGLVTAVPGKSRSWLQWSGTMNRERFLLEIGKEVWDHALTRQRIVSLVLSSFAAATRRGQHKLAETLLIRVLSLEDHSLLPGGESDFSDLLVEGLRRFGPGVVKDTAALRRGLEVLPQSAGDRSVLLALRGRYLLREEPDLAGRDFRMALVLAKGSGDWGQVAEVVAQAGAGYLDLGQPGIALEWFNQCPFQSFLEWALESAGPGQVPGAHPLGLLAGALLLTGRYPRALDLAEVMKEHEPGPGSRDLLGYGLLIEGMVALAQGQPSRTLELAAKVLDLAAQGRLSPQLRRLASGPAAAASMALGRPEEGVKFLEQGVRPGALGLDWVFTADSVLLALEQAEARGPVRGLSLDGELRVMLDSENRFLKGLAQLHLVRRILRLGGDQVPGDMVRQHLLAAESHLAEAGAAPWLTQAQTLARAGAAAPGSADPSWAVPEAPRAPEPGPGGLLTLLTELLAALAAFGYETSGVPGDRLQTLLGLLVDKLAAERAAIISSTGDGQVLASLGGSLEWVDALMDMVPSRRGSECLFLPALELARLEPDDPGQLLLIPLDQPDGASQAGAGESEAWWLCLENRLTRPILTRDHRSLIQVLAKSASLALRHDRAKTAELSRLAKLEQELSFCRNHHWDLRFAELFPKGSDQSRGFHEQVDAASRMRAVVQLRAVPGAGGREVARELHQRGERSRGPFIWVDLVEHPGLQEGEVESSGKLLELCLLADQGTLFLEEISLLSQRNQEVLVQALVQGVWDPVEPRQADFRLVCSSGHDLELLVQEGRFRRDLLDRLSGLVIQVPEIGMRTWDLPEVAEAMARKAAARMLSHGFKLSPEQHSRLQGRGWPGGLGELAAEVSLLVQGIERPPLTWSEGQAPLSLEACEREHIRQVLTLTRGRVAGPGGAAEILQVNPSTLRFRISKLGLTRFLAQIRGA